MNFAGEDQLEWWAPGTVPAPASIVWCAFPDHIRPGSPGPKERPALVFSARQADDPPQNRFLVQVAYGTSVTKDGRRLFDFHIANWAKRVVCRLPQSTRFDLDQVLWLPWAKPYFVARNNDGDPFETPVISVLPKDEQMDLAWLMRERENRGMNEHFKSGC